MALWDCSEPLFHFPGIISMAGNKTVWPRHSVLRLYNSPCGIMALFIGQILLWWPQTSRSPFFGSLAVFPHCLATADAFPQTWGEHSRDQRHTAHEHAQTKQGQGWRFNNWLIIIRKSTPFFYWIKEKQTNARRTVTSYKQRNGSSDDGAVAKNKKDWQTWNCKNWSSRIIPYHIPYIISRRVGSNRRHI